MGTCHLCCEEKKLVKAHLLPEAFFRFMYPDGKNDGSALMLVERGKDYPGQSRIGLYDQNILCDTCDGDLGTYDEYGATILLHSEPKFIVKTDHGEGFIFDRGDPGKLKLFFLSVLWRFSVSTLPETQSIKLPIQFENVLQQMIRNGNPGGVDDFSVVITRLKYRNPDDELHKIFTVPSRGRTHGGINHWTLHIPNGYEVLIKVDSRSQSDKLRGTTLCNGKKVYVVCAKTFEDSVTGKAVAALARNAKF